MKRENWSLEKIAVAINSYETQLKTSDDYLYKRASSGNPAGSVNMRKVKQEMQKYDKLYPAAQLIASYNNILESKGMLDFDDLIIKVSQAFQNNEDLLYNYQERFQYILADEYQDTNGSQNEILFTLCNYDDQPNLFVVGDDDQAIYRFQGANMNNIIDFKNKFRPKEFVLDNNYRSNQNILNGAMNLIQYNKERLPYLYPHLTKNLKQSIENIGGIGLQISCYATIQSQEVGIIQKINALKDSGVEWKDIAIMYRHHNEATDLVKYFSINGIPFTLKRKINILELRDIKRLIAILKYVYGEYKEKASMTAYLFEILHFDFFNLNPNDIGTLSLYASNRTEEETDDKYWRDVLNNIEELKSIGVNQPEQLNKVYLTLEDFIQAIPNVTLQVLFERILTGSGLLSQILNDENKTHRNEAINALFNFIKESTANDETFNLQKLLETIEKMIYFNVPLPLNKINNASNGINLMTVHGSKGLEFDHVFVMNVHEKNWVQSTEKRSKFKYPPTLVNASLISDEEDDRRLFYVAITRAKQNAFVCYGLKDQSGNDLMPCKFITELGCDLTDVKVTNPSESLINDYIYSILKYQSGKAALIDKGLIDRELSKMYISATAIDKYLKCPVSFYFEKILKVPMARTSTMGYGNAIHYALEKYFSAQNYDPNRALPPKEYLITLFHKGMKKYHSHFTQAEIERLRFNGEKSLMHYYDQHHASWTAPIDTKLEYKVKTAVAEIPISGIIDKIEIYHDRIIVYDYKTGRYNTNDFKVGNEDEYGGDKWRQIVFYKILLQNDPGKSWRMSHGVMDFVEGKEEKSVKKEIYVSNQDLDVVIGQIKLVYDSIKNYKFTEGCNEVDCKWCNFVKENMLPESPMAGEIEEDEISFLNE
jgi:DNA helicase-2/ATP-dependent DNA helicase PcrA